MWSVDPSRSMSFMIVCSWSSSTHQYGSKSELCKSPSRSPVLPPPFLMIENAFLSVNCEVPLLGFSHFQESCCLYQPAVASLVLVTGIAIDAHFSQSDGSCKF